ncbi:protoheme IX farnesyltransferase, mitochondrial isoform X4 [Xiphias gladius]|uniref:protoheme IX farnesyltransferase, mitochondrial isoform X4 n=1 Tax=Xiphias gladius TaxID=8245 RepID=UPI001A97D77B|nr:protoheme IX farnesyltransferase, mitochondrial isoform X4 [Xiphias gladius]
MYKTPCSRLSGLVGASLKQKLVQNIPRCDQTARSLIQLHRREPSNWLTYQHLSFLKRQYVAKNNSELHQRAIPKQEAVLTIVDERDDGVERQVQRIPTIDPVVADAVPQSEDVTSKTKPEVKPTTEDVAVQKDSVSNTALISDETPHVQVETDEAREARLDRQWKQLKVDVTDLPDIYARLAKIKLTALVVTTAAAGYAMAPVPFDPVIFFVSSLGTGLASCTANSINQYFEVPFDSNMNRTKNRPLVRGQIRCFVAGWFPVQLAVPPLQRPQLELAGRLLPRRLPHDVRHPPWHVQAGGPAPQLGSDRPVSLSTGHGRHHLDLPCRLLTHQPVHQLPGLPLLPQGGPQQRPQVVLLQPLAPAHAAAAGAHLQEASHRPGGCGSTSSLLFTPRTAELTGFVVASSTSKTSETLILTEYSLGLSPNHPSRLVVAG